MIKKVFTALLVALAAAVPALAQQATGITGLIHTPTAFTGREGDYRIGAHWLNSHTLPSNFVYDGKPYDSAQFYAGISMFRWLEFSYSFILMRGWKGAYDPNASGYNHKDQMFSAKIRILPEGRYYPAIAVGGNDIFTSDVAGSNQYHANLYAALSKTLLLGHQRFGISMAYRYWKSPANSRWQGLTGGIEYTPSLLPQTSLMAEWTGCDINLALNATLLRHLTLQASLLAGRWPSAGIAWTGNLF